MIAKKKAYINLDTETMSLKSYKGLIWQLGLSIVDSALNTIHDEEVTSYAHPCLWDDATLNWATKTYGADFLPRLLEYGNENLVAQSVPIAVFFRDACAALEKQGYEPWIVANHTHFDVTALQALFDRLDWAFPVKYNHILDLPSLMVGSDSRHALLEGSAIQVQTPSAILSGLGKLKSAVAHTALADAMDQVDTLRRLSLYLPN